MKFPKLGGRELGAELGVAGTADGMVLGTPPRKRGCRRRRFKLVKRSAVSMGSIG